jgi:hypothetical protein
VGTSELRSDTFFYFIESTQQKTCALHQITASVFFRLHLPALAIKACKKLTRTHTQRLSFDILMAEVGVPFMENEFVSPLPEGEQPGGCRWPYAC